jgi:predicted RNA-binding protein YlqC (UPF0109 family)
MVISIIKKLFTGAGESEEAPQPERERPPAKAKATEAEPSIEAFVTFVVQSLVDSPDLVSVTTVEKNRGTTIQVECDKKDVGKIIGKSGRTIAAIRALTNGAAGRLGKRVSVEVLD